MKDRFGKSTLLGLALFAAQTLSLAFVEHAHLERGPSCAVCLFQTTVETAKTEAVVVFPQVVEFPRQQLRQARPSAVVFFLLRTRAPPG